MDSIEQLLQRGQQAQGGGVSQAPLSATEAEHIINQLQPLGIEDVGSNKWHQQHEWIERLNLQAHYNAQTNSDEFVVELLVSLDKLQVLVHDLLVMEAWKEHVYPLLAGHLAEHVDSVSAYVLLYHEVAVANLLQVCLYHSHAAESLSEDFGLEVADWCYRRLTRLVAEGHRLAEHRERTAEQMLAMTKLEEQEEKRRETEWGVLMCGLNITRYVTDALPRMPLGALTRAVSVNDTLMALLPLLDRPPWVRTRQPLDPKTGAKGRPVLEKWVGNRWAVVPPADRLKITQTDGQVWLAVTNLLVEPRCRARYALDEYRRERLLGLKRHLNELMFDQLPVLKDLQRSLDELALGATPDQAGSGRAAALILEAVPVVREALLRGKNWRQVADAAVKQHFSGEAARRMARERMEAMLKHLDFMCEMEPAAPEAASSVAAAANGGGGGGGAAPPPVKVCTWRKVHDSGGGVFESWYDFAMALDDSRPPEPVEVAAPAGSSGSSSSSGSSKTAPVAVQGLRYRLKPLELDDTRPLPANGKASVRWGDLAAEALLSLPELPTRDSGEGAAVLWVTVGLLAVDGLALQVKLKKAPKPKERDRVAGVWYAYHPVAGALTVLQDFAPGAAAAGAAAAGAGTAAAPKPAPGAGSSSSGGGAGGKAGAAAAAPAAAAAKPLVQVLQEPAGKAAPAPKAAAALSATAATASSSAAAAPSAGPAAAPAKTSPAAAPAAKPSPAAPAPAPAAPKITELTSPVPPPQAPQPAVPAAPQAATATATAASTSSSSSRTPAPVSIPDAAGMGSQQQHEEPPLSPLAGDDVDDDDEDSPGLDDPE
ncbi:hypothetical protein CHLRE_08g358751v5 [Chlamydomonas reinhardtii]|uniref:Uncharacterized protein n=1 Tax=Chlamydomonas reinhardtii TaxID=3055 RepID=A0A2K3DGB3_CHLRE|nr:uncharacterized protein CHLRE_08g358751v5 [Chlamydomonas reinhardtii]PNW79580.1 hypothetical protein CHLRE_08g358751v5 [Chlamydomonas reinhardtii]